MISSAETKLGAAQWPLLSAVGEDFQTDSLGDVRVSLSLLLLCLQFGGLLGGDMRERCCQVGWKRFRSRFCPR